MALFPGYTEDFENGCEQMNLSMRGIVKSFGANDVLKSVDFSLRGGEICALLGENGAGKSTLMNILGGVLRPDAGQILLDDKPQTFQNPSQSLDAGIAFIHQELNLINDLPIYENMFIGRELKKKNGFLDHPRMIAETRKVFERMALTLDPRAMVRDLDASYKQIVEISRALLMNAQIIIMDEPTTSLTDPEIEHVFEILRTLKKQNVGIVFISHKLREVMEICDRYTVLRDGVMVSEGYVRDVTTDLLARDMVGHDVRNEPLNRSVKLGDEVLRLEDLTQEPHYRHISLSVRAGEVLGVTGLLGDGRSEIFRTVFGDTGKYQGNIIVNGKSVQMHSTQQALALGIGLGIGLYDGLVGPGTGTFAIIAFSSLMKFDLRTANGNGKVLNLASNYASLFTYLMNGLVVFHIGIPCAVSNILGNLLGSHFALKKGARFIRPMMLVVLVLLLGKLISDAVL